MSKRTKQVVLSVIVTMFVFVSGQSAADEVYDKFADFFRNLIEIEREMGDINWQIEVGDISGDDNINAASDKIAALSAQYQEKFTSSTMTDFFKAVEDARDEVDNVTTAIYNKAKEDYEKLNCIPKDEYEAFSKLQTDAYQAWYEAKEKSDYTIFSPYLKRLVKYQKKVVGWREKAGFVYANPYDAMLDDYEPGMTVKELDEFFEELRLGVVPLLERVMSAPKIISGDFRYREVPLDVQRKFSPFIMETLGFDMSQDENKRLRESEHPFTASFGPKDTRITTHYDKNDFFASFYSVAHESGHAIYEQNINPELEWTILGTGASYGIHESQSRFYENMAARSLPFLEGIYDEFIRRTNGCFDDVSALELYEAVNIVKPSPIRVTADELTYSLHIMVRYDIEKMLFDTPDYKIDALIDDLPSIWNKKMQDYLGVTPANDAEGILQDVHWSYGEFGYFPTYALGNAYSAQILNAMKKDIDVQSSLHVADFSKINAWLGKKIHWYGSLLSPEEILENITDEGFSPRYYVEYLTGKYEALYGLERSSGGCVTGVFPLPALLLLLAVLIWRTDTRNNRSS